MQKGVFNQQDEQLERDIDAACQVVINPEADRFVRSTAVETMRRLIALRSPERIAEMERAKGIA